MHRVAWIGLWIGLAVSACAPSLALEKYQPRNQEEAMVVAALLRIPNGIKGRSLELLMLPYADDVYIGNFQKYLGVAGPQAPLSMSKSDLRTAYAQVLRGAKDLSMDIRDFQLTVSGDRAVAEARTELIYKFEAGRKEARQEVFRNDVVWRLRRTPAGWKITEEIWQ